MTRGVVSCKTTYSESTFTELAHARWLAAMLWHCAFTELAHRRVGWLLCSGTVRLPSTYAGWLLCSLGPALSALIRLSSEPVCTHLTMSVWPLGRMVVCWPFALFAISLVLSVELLVKAGFEEGLYPTSRFGSWSLRY